MPIANMLLSAVCILFAEISCVAAAPLSSDVAIQAGGGLPNNGFPTLISEDAIKEFQLTLFLENLEAFFFKSGLANLTSWETSGYSNDTAEVISKIAAVRESGVMFKRSELTRTIIARRGSCSDFNSLASGLRPNGNPSLQLHISGHIDGPVPRVQ